ncbi:MAG: 50S ribosomal protein L17 [Candidatus Jacksonbacteria bacterium RIFOXYC2_FULL_44_29]|nr:MAG: 50S ribosomal protein L17 [Parcubacteria group bacterium GW2011_GWA2_42_28]KKT55452.1 MAG: 50S ribosomal protein L17 [Parcubacteria group bacterium GW2011_GWC2_44_22]OGY75238.1 MAG: 50S ribosomal protein L17 [Candidatus Jacksonbacteria bacterium RIFOXYA2_FULL_43_12]OGY75941.1 MAG: 50S ribosomal protein L17 [Candidatus Jacksonbacteria bacterium RIFOXYB2_FULL_44_15]OGY77956.1 MAG: 50S ribosomal protein L17 [Candidatus Jacksonbacteria bacterium RIFOXYC2_FULL_44_29]OGY80542.1 MAG: 50S ribo
MRHRKKSKIFAKQNRLSRSVLKNQAVSLILHEHILTTKVKASALRQTVERLVTTAKNQNLTARRRLIAYLPKMGAVQKLMEELAPRYLNRQGGYTRVIKVGQRKGDGAPVSKIEFV